VHPFAACDDETGGGQEEEESADCVGCCAQDGCMLDARQLQLNCPLPCITERLGGHWSAQHPLITVQMSWLAGVRLREGPRMGLLGDRGSVTKKGMRRKWCRSGQSVH
jgi:hypothetical protein